VRVLYVYPCLLERCSGSLLVNLSWVLLYMVVSSISSGYGGIYTVSTQNKDWVTQSCLLCVKTGVACI
jgi:hypothetical protein